MTTAASGEVLLTGATGFVGMELLARYLERDRCNIIAPVRAADDREAGNRIDAVLVNLFGDSGGDYRHRVEAVAADLRSHGLGLTPARTTELAERVDVIVHAAASVSFDSPLECSRETNVGGARQMLSLAEAAMAHGGLSRYVHVSTAYVAGTHPGVFAESDLALGQCFHNFYEQSKFESEQLLREHRGLPITVVRPSIVVGDRHTGWTAAFNVIYWPLRALSRGLLGTVPAIPSAPVDVVSIDYVADAIHALSRHPAAADATYHLTAGRESSSIGEIASLASSYFGRPQPRLIPPPAFDAGAEGSTSRGMMEQAQAYFPYFCIEATFDDAASRALLEPLGIRVSPLSEYMDRLLDFATHSGWGKRLVSRAGAREALALA